MIPPAARRLSGAEPLIAPGLEMGNATVLDLWQWAFSDLHLNSLRGVFAEWLVARLLDLPLPTRDFWAGWDLQTPEGVKTEVKAATYPQAWEQKRPSQIIFSGLKGQLWSPQTGYSGAATYNADLYVFCLQTETDPARWDVLDLTQWRFYLLDQAALAMRGIKSISLPVLATLCPTLTAGELREQILARVQSQGTLASSQTGQGGAAWTRPGSSGLPS